MFSSIDEAVRSTVWTARSTAQPDRSILRMERLIVRAARSIVAAVESTDEVPRWIVCESPSIVRVARSIPLLAASPEVAPAPIFFQAALLEENALPPLQAAATAVNAPRSKEKAPKPAVGATEPLRHLVRFAPDSRHSRPQALVSPGVEGPLFVPKRLDRIARRRPARRQIASP